MPSTEGHPLMVAFFRRLPLGMAVTARTTGSMLFVPVVICVVYINLTAGVPYRLTSVRTTPAINVSDVPSPSKQLELVEGAILGWKPSVTYGHRQVFDGRDVFTHSLAQGFEKETYGWLLNTLAFFSFESYRVHCTMDRRWPAVTDDNVCLNS